MPDPRITSEDEEVSSALRSAVAGVTYPSESDEPFDVFVWKAAEADPLKQIRLQGKNAVSAKETSLDDFFAELITADEGGKFRRLRQTLESHLSSVRVFRIGDVEVDVYVIGKTKSGSWAGVHTVSVET